MRLISVTGRVTVGPGNTISGNSSDGVQIASSSNQRIVANSIFGNGLSDGQGINLVSGANHNINAPAITDASTLAGTTTGHGTFQGTSGQVVFIEFFSSPSCDPNGGGQNYLGAITAAANGNGLAQFTFSVPTGPGQAFITATATDTTAVDTSGFSNCFASTVVGSLSATLSQPVDQHIDLTAPGSQDWAVWGFGGSTSLTAAVRKANGSGISDLSPSSPNDGPARNFSQFSFPLVPFGFDWSDGTRLSRRLARAPASPRPSRTGLFVHRSR